MHSSQTSAGAQCRDCLAPRSNMLLDVAAWCTAMLEAYGMHFTQYTHVDASCTLTTRGHHRPANCCGAPDGISASLQGRLVGQQRMHPGTQGGSCGLRRCFRQLVSGASSITAALRARLRARLRQRLCTRQTPHDRLSCYMEGKNSPSCHHDIAIQHEVRNRPPIALLSECAISLQRTHNAVATDCDQVDSHCGCSPSAAAATSATVGAAGAATSAMRTALQCWRNCTSGAVSAALSLW